MTQKTINIGTVANDGTGDTLRGAFANTNSNFTELYTHHSNNAANVTVVFNRANLVFDRTNTAYDLANTANTKASLKGPYDTDIEAAINGVPVGGLYYKPQGNVHIRLA